MIALTWTCPYCRGTGEVKPDDMALHRCGGCGFVSPIEPDLPEEPTSESASDLAATTARPPGPVRSDRYAILRSLGSGAQGELWLARDRHLDQFCVIKVLKTGDDTWTEVAINRLRIEARAGVAVNHPNVARVFDCDCVDGCWYFVMEYVHGENLRRVVRSVGRMPWKQAVQVGIAAAEGLAAIHDAGLVHRDIKPGNLMLRTDGGVKIMDLGLVKVHGTAPDLALTRVGQLLGTPYYMAPEQFETEGDVASRADLYALGATLFHLVTGRPPFEGTGVLDIAQKHRREPVVWSDEIAARVPSWFRQVVDVCLAKRPEHRFPSASDLAEALRAGGVGQNAALSSPESSPAGVTVLAFRNISGQATDDWIGEAIAECLTNRLMRLQDVHLADRASFAKMLDRTPADPRTGPDNDQILEAARMVGASSVVTGGFQRVADNLRITAHLLVANQPSPRPVASVSGPADHLFALEDQVADKLIEIIGHALASKRRRRRAAGGTDSLEAMEKLIRGRRAFADGDYHEAIRLAEEAQAIDPDYVEPISLIGACYARLAQYDRALECHQKQERLARHLDDQPALAEALGNIGVMYYYKGEYPLAYEFLERATAISAELGLRGESAKYRGNLGFVFMRLNRYEEAETAFAQAIDINKQLGDLVSLQWPYNGMGSVLLKQQRYTEAREYYQRALALAVEIGDRVNTGVSHMNLGRCACMLDRFDDAQSRFDAALSTLQGTDFWNGLTLVYEGLAEMHLRLNNLPEALGSIDHRIDLARRHGNNRMEADAWEQKARAHEQMGQTETALQCLRQSVTVSQRPAPYESLHVYLQEISQRPAFH